MARYVALLGGVGAVLFAFGLLSAILAAFQPVTDWGWVWGNLVLGALLLLAAAAVNLDGLRERMSSGEAKRAGRYGTSAILTAVLGLGILGMLAFVSTRYSTRYDWSADQVHTLSDQTQKVLAGLDRNVDITAFFNPLDGPQVRALLDRYDLGSERVSLEFADPTARPDLVTGFGIDAQDLAKGLVHIGVEGGDSTTITEEFSEAAVTNALVKLTRGGDRKVYFLIGHNERVALGDGAGELPGFARAAQALANETYGVESLLLASAGAVPEDADAVIIAAPTRPLLEPEHAALQTYLAGGGALFVMLDPRSNSDLAGDLARWGIDVGDDVIVDRQLALFGRATTPFAQRYEENHPITAEMRETTLFHLARSVMPRAGAEGVQTIVWTGEGSWAERDLDAWAATGRAAYEEPDDLLGPVPIAVAGEASFGAEEGAGAKGRIVAFGDADWAANEHLDNFSNRDLFVNSVNWLVGDVENISLRPNLARASRFQPTAEEFRRVQYLSLFVLPEAIAVLGVFAWWSRRKAPGR